MRRKPACGLGRPISEGRIQSEILNTVFHRYVLRRCIMTQRLAMLILVALLFAAFFLVNWNALAIPIHLNLLFYSFDLANGILLGGLLGIAAGVLMIYFGFSQRRLRLANRRLEVELLALQRLVNGAEGSRIIELQKSIADEMAKLGKDLTASIDGVRSELRDTEHSIAATLGEIDDRLSRNMQGDSNQSIADTK